MRNLKRILSLTLASAMLFGMMVMGASAADYTDTKDISHAEAVAVMSAIGVFQGTDSKFNPKGDLTRESAAKIITFMMMGKEAADGLATSAAPFKDVAANRWSAGSIAYCVNNNIIAGDGQGNFFPELTVTGAAFAKMLLGALGYSAENEKLTGTGWEVNVAKLVQSTKLGSGLSAALSKTMTREQAAQMAFNAMAAKTVTYQGGTNITTSDGTVINMGGIRIIGDDSFSKINYPSLKNVKDTNGDAFGRPAMKWTYGTPVKTIGTYGTTATITYTAEATDKAVKGDLDGYTYGTGATIVYNDKGDTTDGTATKYDDIQKLTKNGRAVEIYATDGVITDVIVTDTTLATVGTVNAVGKTVTVTGYTIVKDDNAVYSALASMKKDDKVLIQSNGNDIIGVSAPETASGTYTRMSKGVRTIGGESYTDSHTATGKLTTDLKLGSDFELFIDTYGYLIGASATTTAANSYAYLAATDETGSASTGLTFMAKLVFADGTQEWVDLSSVNDTATADFTAKDDSKWVAFKAAKVVTYGEKSDGTYAVSSVKAGTAGSADATSEVPLTYTWTGKDATITKGEPNFLSKDAKIVGSSKTIFLVQSGNSVKVYEGVKNVPTLSAVSCTVLTDKKSTSANMVIVTDKTEVGDSASIVFIGSGTYGSDYDTDLKKEVYTFNAVQKGEVVTLTTTTLKDAAGTDLAQGLYTVAYNDKGYGITLTAVVDKAGESVTHASKGDVSNGTITLNSKSYVTSDDFKVFSTNDKGEIVEITAADVEYYTATSTSLIYNTDAKFIDVMVIAATLAS